MPRSTLAPMALPLRRVATSVCVLMVLTAGVTVPELEVFAPAAAASPWDQVGADIDGAAAGDQSGYSIALSDDGTRLAVGAIRDAGTQAGYVRVFQWSGSTWVQLGTDINAQSTSDESGFSVALSADGTRLAVGARLNSGAANLAGHVRVFEWSGTAWQQMGTDVDGEAQYEQSGYSVALSDDGSRLAVGAPGGNSNRGLVRVYAWSGSEWSQLGATIAGDSTSDTAGWSVALSADGARLAVGAPGTDGSASNAGRVSVFTWSGSAWTLLGSVDGEAADDFSGRSVALSADGARLAVGAAKNDGAGADSGHVRVYAWSGSAWLQLGADVDGEEANDQSGNAVALSADGSRLAVGASGAGPGHVRVFLWSGSAWVQLGESVEGEADGDRSGSSVALTADGAAVAVGASRNDGTGDNAGHVRVHGSLTATPMLGPPFGVAGVAGDSEATVSWSAPLSDGGSPITAYTVTAAPGGDTCSTSGALTCTVTDLVNGTGYTFTVTATNADGTSPASAPSGWLTPATLPDAPSGTAASVSGDAKAVVWWSAPAFDGGSAVTAYTVTAAPGGGTCSSSGALSCTVTGLTIGTAYTFTVAATNGVGTGPESVASDPLVAAASPGAPSGVVATAGDSEASVSWTPPTSNGGSPITGYTVTASPGDQTCTTTGALTCTVTPLANGTTYTFTTTATNSVGTSPASTLSNPVTPTTTPSAPSDVTATAGNSHASVSWTPPTSNGGSPITGYTVTASPGDQTCTTTSALTCTVTGLTIGTAYTFVVTATNGVGTGPASTPSNPVTPTTTPSAPSSVVATAGDAEVSVSWTAPATNGGTAITGYTVTTSPGGQTCTTTGATTCTVTALTNDVAYAFTATATNSVGTSPASPPSDPVTPTTTGGVASVVPDPPTDVEAAPGDSEASVSWTAPDTDGSIPITGYTVTASPGSATCSTSGALSCTVTGLTNGVTYSFTVIVMISEGVSTASPESDAVTPEATSSEGGSLAYLPPCPSPELAFIDIDSVISQADIACIRGLGITTGTSPTTYNPDGLVDRDQMATFLARLWRATGRECPTPELAFIDIDSVISQADIACIRGLGITTGTSPTTYNPDGLVDRDQMATFLARLWRALGAA